MTYHAQERNAHRIDMTVATCKPRITMSEPAFPGAQSVSALRWTSDAKHLYVGANDHNLRIFGVAAAESEAA